MKYEYKLLESFPDSSKSFNMKDINELGGKSWRIVQLIIRDDGYEACLMEKEINESSF